MRTLVCLVVVSCTCYPVVAQPLLTTDDSITVRQKLINRVKEIEQARPIWQQDFLGWNKPPEARSNYELLSEIMKASSITEDEALLALGGKKDTAPIWFHPLVAAGMSVLLLACMLFTMKFYGALRAVQVALLVAFVLCGLYPPWNAQLFLGQPLGYAPIYAPPQGIVYLDFARLAVEWIVLVVVMSVVSKWHSQPPASSLPDKKQKTTVPVEQQVENNAPL